MKQGRRCGLQPQPENSKRLPRQAGNTMKAHPMQRHRLNRIERDQQLLRQTGMRWKVRPGIRPSRTWTLLPDTMKMSYCTVLLRIEAWCQWLRGTGLRNTTWVLHRRGLNSSLNNRLWAYRCDRRTCSDSTSLRLPSQSWWLHSRFRVSMSECPPRSSAIRSIPMERVWSQVHCWQMMVPQPLQLQTAWAPCDCTSQHTLQDSRTASGGSTEDDRAYSPLGTRSEDRCPVGDQHSSPWHP